MESNKTATSLKIYQPWWLIGRVLYKWWSASRVEGIAEQQQLKNQEEHMSMLSEEDSFKRKAFIMSN